MDKKIDDDAKMSEWRQVDRPKSGLGMALCRGPGRSPFPFLIEVFITANRFNSNSPTLTGGGIHLYWLGGCTIISFAKRSNIWR